MAKPTTTAALYLRVSTTDKGQETDNQLLQLKKYCKRQGYTIDQVYVDHETGQKGRATRQQFDQLFKDAAQGKFDLVIFWSLDRFTREGIKKTMHYLQLLDSYGVKFHSYTEEYLNTDNELVGHIVIGVMAYFAQAETKRISKRTKAGLERARKQGKRLGKPPLNDKIKKRIKELATNGTPKKAIARKLKVSLNTVKKYL